MVTSRVVLQLYVSGETPNSQRAIANLRRLCEEEFAGTYELEVIDIRENPALAEEQKILATPAVIKELPPPLRRVVGDLSDRERVLVGLQLNTLHGAD